MMEKLPDSLILGENQETLKSEVVISIGEDNLPYLMFTDDLKPLEVYGILSYAIQEIGAMIYENKAKSRSGESSERN